MPIQSQLALVRRDYSVNPWRLIVRDADGRERQLSDVSFPRKRDGVPVLQALQALQVPWDQPVATWSDDVYTQVQTIVEQVPSRQWLEQLRGEQRCPGRR
jgi:hypothetical protein